MGTNLFSFSMGLFHSPFNAKLYAPRIFRLFSSQIDASKLTVELSKTLAEKPSWNTLRFGRVFTDHMLVIPWSLQDGWAPPKITPYSPLSLDPATSVFHYGSACFEGMKAYLDSEKRIRLFRPLMNMKRLSRSSERLCLPSVEPHELLKCIEELIKIDKDWIPAEMGYSLYIRPTIIATQNSLGVSPSKTALLFVILSPVGPFYKTGFNAVRLKAETDSVRAWPGGTGSYKISGNYAPTIRPLLNAINEGCQQNLWLIGRDDAIQEVGSMNCFVYWRNEYGELELVTPPLDGQILPGITRSSIIDLCTEWNEFKVSERKITMRMLVNAIEKNRLIEMFGSGTAAIVTPIKEVVYRGKTLNIPIVPNLQSGALANRLMQAILNIQYGLKMHKDWSYMIETRK